MKLCITATGNSLDAQTDGSFGRAPWLIVLDTDNSNSFEAIENTAVNASQGAGIAASQVLVDRGAQGLLTGRVGPKAQAALQAAGITIFENIGAGTVRAILEQFNNGKYQESTEQQNSRMPGTGCGKRGRGGGGQGTGRGQGRRGGI